MTNSAPDQPPKRNTALKYLSWAAAASLVLFLGLLRWGGYLLMSDDPLPRQVDAAIVLQGSVLGERARVAGAVRLFTLGKTDQILLSVPRESYWGESVAPMALAEVRRRYGSEVARHVQFCEMDGVDSTEEEAGALIECVRQRQWRSVAVVTSEYHSRRAGIIWKRVLGTNSYFHVYMHSVPDPEFRAVGWWHKRRWAKTWFFESVKLASVLFGL